MVLERRVQLDIFDGEDPRSSDLVPLCLQELVIVLREIVNLEMGWSAESERICSTLMSDTLYLSPTCSKYLRISGPGA